MNNTFNVSIELIIEALSTVEECGISDNVTSPSIFVDNYLINGGNL